MKEIYEYKIIIGCMDSQTKDEVVSRNEFSEMVTKFFVRMKIDFSITHAEGWYFHIDGSFVSENTLCIGIIDYEDFDIMRLAKSLSMFMNQEQVLITKNVINAKLM